MWPMTASMAERRRSSLDHAENAALLTGDEDAVRIGRVVAAVALVDIGALNRAAAGKLLGAIAAAADLFQHAIAGFGSDWLHHFQR